MLAEYLPPHDLEAERAVIGSLLIDGARFPEVAEIVGERDFYRENHAMAFRAIAEVSRSGGGVDQVAVADRLRAEVQDEQARGNLRALLSVAVAETPTAVNAVHYAGIVRRCSDLRRAIALANEIAAAAYRSDADPGAIAEIVVRGGLELGRGSAGPRALRPIREHADAAYNRLQEIYDGGPEALGIPSGLSASFDRKLGGLQRGRFYVVAARTSAGKTTLLVQIAINVAARGQRVVYYSLEESSIDLIARMISVEMQVDWKRLNPFERALRGRDFVAALGRVSDLPILTTDAARLSLGDMHGQAAVLGARDPLGLIVIDYLNLTDEPRAGRESRVDVLGRVTRGLKRLARELDVPVIAAAQLNREVEHRQSREPMLSDIRESGDVEQDADVVVLLYRPYYYVERGMAKLPDVRPQDFTGTDDDLKILLRANVAKNRSGPIGAVNLKYDPATGRIGMWMGRGENDA